MERTLLWIDGNASGWACSVCQWRFLVPTLLSGQEAREAYDRLAAAKFQEHTCETQTGLPAATQKVNLRGNTSLAERARMFIKRGYKPKDAVGLVLQEMEFEHGNDPRIMEKARADAEDFLQKVRRGLI